LPITDHLESKKLKQRANTLVIGRVMVESRAIEAMAKETSLKVNVTVMVWPDMKAKFVLE